MKALKRLSLVLLLPLLSAAQPKEAYVFTYFVGNGADGLHLAGSEDGYHWEALNGGKSYLKPVVGESRLMRDPCVVRGRDGRYHLVWTTAWEGQTIGHASSTDLVHWSEQQAIAVMKHEPGVRNCWAPEVVFVPDTNEYLLFWASTVRGKFEETAGASEDGYNHRIYATTTKDFESFSPTVLFFDPGFSVIDATLFQALGRWHMVVKDETLNPPKKHLRLASSATAFGPWAPLSAPFTRDWVEGPTVMEVGADLLVYFDVYREKHYGAMKTRDLKVWADITPEISLPPGVRHGTILRIPLELLESLRNPPRSETD